MLALLLLLTLNLNMIESQLTVVLMHGIASDKTNMNDMQTWIQESFNVSVYNIDIGNGYNTSINTPMMIQTQLLCEVISSITELSNGFNFIGMSQGGLLARAYVEKCNIPKVNNLITLVSPHGGEYDPDTLFNIINIYGPLLQSTTSFASYWRDPTRYIEYLTKC
jgi:palmitoyl-protein thioesterase